MVISYMMVKLNFTESTKGPTIRSSSLFLFYVFVLAACPFWGQAFQKKALTPKDYALWSTMYTTGISANGQWVCGLIQYEQATDTLYLKNTQHGLSYTFSNVHRGKFSDNSKWFAFLDPNKGLGLLALDQTGATIEWTANVQRFEFSKEGRYLLMELSGKQIRQLKIKDLKKGSVENLTNVNGYQWSPDRNLLAYTNEHENNIYLVQLGKKFEVIPIETALGKKVGSITWNHTSTAFAYKWEYGSGKIGIGLYNTLPSNPKRFDLVEETDPMFFEGRDIMDHKLIVSDDGQRVFFKVILTNIKDAFNRPRPDPKIQIWDTRDAWIYPRQKMNAGIFTRGWDAVWWVESNLLYQITDSTLPKMVLTGDQQNVLTYNPLTNEPAPTERGDLDLYITSLSSGKRELFLQRQPDYLGITKISPNGKYISYFRKGHWWTYNIKDKVHTNVTKNFPAALYKENHDLPIVPPPYGHPGWTEGDSSLVIYDAYNIWEVSPDGRKQKRLTDGGPKGNQYRIYEKNLINTQFRNNDRFEGLEINLNNPILLSSFNYKNKGSGFYNLLKGQLPKPIGEAERHMDLLMKARDKDIYVYREQSFGLPPRLVYKNVKTGEIKTIKQSNKQLHKYYWGKSELIDYNNSVGDKLQGILIYPSDYNKEKKYPMIVKIYERQSQYLNHFKKPSLYEMDGFNATNFSLEGYFVLLPDIKFNSQGPGISALDCTVSAVKAVLKRDVVDKNKIGLIGHSFGGYETNFIITQTNIFAAAVSGASVSNLISFQFSVDWKNTGKSQEWHISEQQWRMKKNYYQDKNIFRRNNPIEFVNNIKTPLLIWTGNKDSHGNWLQEVEFYLALKSQHKKGKLLLYEDEGHALLNPNNAKDLTLRIMDWFAYYLKNQTNTSWVEGKDTYLKMLK